MLISNREASNIWLSYGMTPFLCYDPHQQILESTTTLCFVISQPVWLVTVSLHTVPHFVIFIVIVDDLYNFSNDSFDHSTSSNSKLFLRARSFWSSKLSRLCDVQMRERGEFVSFHTKIQHSLQAFEKGHWLMFFLLLSKLSRICWPLKMHKLKTICFPLFQMHKRYFIKVAINELMKVFISWTISNWKNDYIQEFQGSSMTKVPVKSSVEIKGRAMHTASVYGKNVFIFGGATEEGTVLSDMIVLSIGWFCFPCIRNIFEFFLISVTWLFEFLEKGEMEVLKNRTAPALCGHSACVHEKFIYIFGGHTGTRYSNDLYKFDMGAFNLFTFLCNIRFKKRQDKRNRFLYVLFFGTYTSYSVQRTWTKLKPKGTPPSPRCFHSACFVGTKMYVFGGQINRSGQIEIYDDIYSFNIRTRNEISKFSKGFNAFEILKMILLFFRKWNLDENFVFNTTHSWSLRSHLCCIGQ